MGYALYRADVSHFAHAVRVFLPHPVDKVFADRASAEAAVEKFVGLRWTCLLVRCPPGPPPRSSPGGTSGYMLLRYDAEEDAYVRAKENDTYAALDDAVRAAAEARTRPEEVIEVALAAGPAYVRPDPSAPTPAAPSTETDAESKELTELRAFHREVARALADCWGVEPPPRAADIRAFLEAEWKKGNAAANRVRDIRDELDIAETTLLNLAAAHYLPDGYVVLSKRTPDQR